MGDRVIIEGGTQVGRDHFPYPTIARDLAGTGYSSGSRTPFPITVDTATYLKWFFVLRKWSLVYSANVTYDIGSGPTIFDVELEVQLAPKIYADMTFLDDGRLPDRESDLILPKYGIDFNVNGVVGSTLPDDIGGTVEAYNLFWNTTIGYPPGVYGWASLTLGFGVPYWDGGLRPQVGFEARLARLGDGDESQDFFIDIFESTGLREVGEFIIQDENFDTIFTLPLETADNPRPFTINTAHAELSPNTFWPYATKAGLPVYDIATGAQLADPLS